MKLEPRLTFNKPVIPDWIFVWQACSRSWWRHDYSKLSRMRLGPTRPIGDDASIVRVKEKSLNPCWWLTPAFDHQMCLPKMYSVRSKNVKMFNRSMQASNMQNVFKYSQTNIKYQMAWLELSTSVELTQSSTKKWYVIQNYVEKVKSKPVVLKWSCKPVRAGGKCHAASCNKFLMILLSKFYLT